MKNLKVSRKLIALLVAGGIAFAPVSASLANDIYHEGTFIEQNDEEKNYIEYVVMKGDNLSLISQKICAYFDETLDTKYWPALAFLNNFPRVLKPGDVIVFPKTFEALQFLTETLRKSEWTANYIQKNNIYGNKEKSIISRSIITSLLEDIYGDSVCIDEDFIRKYIDIHGLKNTYDLMDTDTYDPKVFLDLTIWIPTLNDLGIETNENTLQKTK